MYLQPNPALREMLLSIPKKRWIFTNSDQPHVERVLSILGISDCFNGLVDVYALEPHCKPKREAYQIALKYAENAYPATCALLDDSVNNLVPAKTMGFFTIWVGQNGTHPMADRSLSDIIDLPEIDAGWAIISIMLVNGISYGLLSWYYSRKGDL